MSEPEYSHYAMRDDFDVETARGVREMEDFLIEMNQMSETDRMKIPPEKEPPERLTPGSDGSEAANVDVIEVSDKA